MTDIRRLGLGCMGMNRSNKEQSIRTVHAALEAGITLFNTGEFYNAGESELVMGEALRGVPRDKYFLSVKFGVLPSPDGRIYGLDVTPFNIKAHLAYSLKRLNLDYIDLFEPARMDLAYPVEEIVGAMADLVKEGYIRHIGLTQIDADTLLRASAVHKIHTVELCYSLADRRYEGKMIRTAKETGTMVLAFGLLGHGLLSDNALARKARKSLPAGYFDQENLEGNLQLVRDLQSLAEKKGTTISRLALAWAWEKNPYMSALMGTTKETHLQDALEALKLELSAEEIEEIERTFPAGKVLGEGMGKFVCRHGRPVTASAV